MERPNPEGHQLPLFKVLLFPSNNRGAFGAHCTECGRRKGFKSKRTAEQWAQDHVCYEDD